MTMIGNKIFKLDKPNGVFIVFGEYDSEEVFNNFLKFIKEKLSAEVKDINQHPYSISAAIKFSFGEATAICQEGIGCAIRVEPGASNIVDEIVVACAKIK